MAALKHLKEKLDDKEWYFHYYGGQENHVQEEAERFGVIERVVLHGRVTQDEAFSAVGGAGVAVVITSVYDEVTKEDQGIVTGKVFEALGLGTPILLVAPSGSDARAIADDTGLVESFNGSDINGIASFLGDLMVGRKALEAKNPEVYAWPNIAKTLDTVLREASARK
jgi:glycosyltransferase involved in cell wall biosynthesis